MADELSFQMVHTTSDHKRQVQVTRIRHAASGFDALAYQCSLEEDFDGAPQCYGDPNASPVNPKDNPATRLQANIKRRDRTGRTPRDDRTALDFLGNATSPHENFDAGSTDFAWVGLYAAPPELAKRKGFSIDQRARLGARRRPRNSDEKPIKGYGNTIPLWPKESSWFPAIQGDDAPAPGFFVSGSPVYANPKLPDWNQRKYVDAQSIPYAALTPWFKTFGANLGDFGIAMDPLTGAASGFVFGDSGYDDKVGEVSTNLLTALGGDNEGSYLFLAFPRSGAPVPGMWKYGANFVSQLAASACVRKLNAVPDPADLMLFLMFGADLAKFNAFRFRRMSDKESIQADSLYHRTGTVIERVLTRYGYEP